MSTRLDHVHYRKAQYILQIFNQSAFGYQGMCTVVYGSATAPRTNHLSLLFGDLSRADCFVRRTVVFMGSHLPAQSCFAVRHRVTHCLSILTCVSPVAPSAHHIFFDDNIHNDAEDSIVAARRRPTAESNFTPVSGVCHHSIRVNRSAIVRCVRISSSTSVLGVFSAISFTSMATVYSHAVDCQLHIW